ncbi:MAG: response regulator transcription factor [Bacteroidetes bacterium]|nr:response regulator transcription factor [Bacteroidota bacterium]
MLISSIIVDDEPRLALGLQKILQQHCPTVNIVAVCFNANDALQQIIKLKPQLVFLDISMPGKNAFDMLSELPQINFEIIFITAHDKYSIQAFKYCATDYLLKPINEEELVNAISKITKRLEQVTSNVNLDLLLQQWQSKKFSQLHKICLPTFKGFQVLELKEIIYCEATNTYTNFILTNNKIVCAAKPLIEYETMLEEVGFFRIHKSFLINVNHIISYTKGEGGYVNMSNGKELEVSRRKKDQFLIKVKEFYKF